MKISRDNKNLLEIKLLILNTPEINFNRMFYNCSSLKYFSIKTKFEPKLRNKIIKEQKDSPIDHLIINNSEEINKDSFSSFSLFNNSDNKTEKISEINDIFDFSYDKNTFQNIFSLSNKNDTSEDRKKQINHILFHSHNFLRQFQ